MFNVVVAETGCLIQAEAVSPDGNRALSRLVNSDQPDAGVIVLDLRDFSWNMVLTGHFLWAVRWLDEREALLTATTRVGDRREREYRIYRLGEDGNALPLVTEKNELRILGVHDGILHYLEQYEKEPAVWVWVYRPLVL